MLFTNAINVFLANLHAAVFFFKCYPSPPYTHHLLCTRAAKSQVRSERDGLRQSANSIFARSPSHLHFQRWSVSKRTFPHTCDAGKLDLSRLSWTLIVKLATVVHEHFARWSRSKERVLPLAAAFSQRGGSRMHAPALWHQNFHPAFVECD